MENEGFEVLRGQVGFMDAVKLMSRMMSLAVMGGEVRVTYW